MKKKTRLFTLVFLVFPYYVGALAAEKKIYHIYETRQHDSIESIAKQFLPSHEREYGKNHIEEYINDLKFWNPHVKNWKSIAENTKIYVDYPYPPFPAPKLLMATKIPATEDFEPEEPDKFPEENRLKIFSMFTLSRGNFDEKLTTGVGEIKSQQNSPFTLGIGGNYKFTESNHMLAASAYTSFLKMAAVSGDTTFTSSSTSIPNEMGANLYHQHLIKEFDFSVYEGFDYEKFSSFNIAEYVLQNAELSINSNTILLATLGVGNSFYFGNFIMTAKLSAAKVIRSTTTSATSSPFNGERYLLFISVRGMNKFSYNFLYKKHVLTGPNNLDVERVGLGLSYELL